MAETVHKFVYHYLHHQNNFYCRNDLNQTLVFFLFYIAHCLILLSFANVAIFSSKSELSAYPETSNLKINPFTFIFFLGILPMQLL